MPSLLAAPASVTQSIIVGVQVGAQRGGPCQRRRLRQRVAPWHRQIRQPAPPDPEARLASSSAANRFGRHARGHGPPLQHCWLHAQLFSRVLRASTWSDAATSWEKACTGCSHWQRGFIAKSPQALLMPPVVRGLRQYRHLCPPPGCEELGRTRVRGHRRRWSAQQDLHGRGGQELPYCSRRRTMCGIS